ncbi:MAG: helix-turn-helix transcriptional regulator [Clostridia bacterium]|nr:helix-turn-helix transcriptional regulator [Clostridia bacterium]
MNYTQRIRALREDKDLKQKDIAIILKKSQQGYAHLENEQARLSIEDLIALCKFYNVSADYILGFTDTVTPLPKK